MKHETRVRFELNQGKNKLQLGRALKKLEKIISREFKKKGMISVALIDSKKSKNLNSAYRKKNKPADVLTFVLGDNDCLGEILLSFEEIKIRAKKSKTTILDTAVYLVIHGVCHIFGYTHKNKKDTEKMEAKEAKIMKNI